MPLHIPVTINVYDHVETDIVHRHDAEVSELAGAFLKKKEITVGWLFGHNKVKVAFDLRSGHDGVPVYAQLYVNDVVKGVQQSERGTSYVTKTETLSEMLDLDKIQFYLRGMPARNLIAGCGLVGEEEEITVYGGIIDGVFEVFDGVSGYFLTGLAFDGTNLISCASKDDGSEAIIYFHDGVSSSILSSYNGWTRGSSGLTFDGTDLIQCESYNDKIFVHDGLARVVKAQFNAPAAQPSGLAFDGANLISCDRGTDKIYVHVGINEAVDHSFDAPSANPFGLAFDGVNLISADFYANKIYVHNGVTSSILRSYDYLGGSFYGGLTTYYYPAAASGYAKNLRIVGKIEPMTEKSAVFENTL